MHIVTSLIVFLTIHITCVENYEAMFELFNDKVVYVDKFMANCSNFKNPQLYYAFMTGSGYGGQMTFNYDIVSKILMTAPATLSVETTRCQSKENPDSCMKFATFRTSRLCNLLESTTEFWSPMITCVQPKVGCPMKKGIYRGRNCTLDMSRYNWFPIGEMYWKLKVQIQMKRAQTVGCGVVEGTIVSKKQPK